MIKKLNALYRPPHAVAYAANGYTFWMVPVRKGRFWMGEEEDGYYHDGRPLHEVELSQDYELGQFPVTQALWKGVMGGANPSFFKGDDRPVEHINWFDVQQFLDNLNALPEVAARHALDGRHFRFPTEAQWEYAAKGGPYAPDFAYVYAGSAYLPEVAWYANNSNLQSHPVGRRLPNVLGLYDMSGNVEEWCYDWHDEYPDGNTPLKDPAGPEQGHVKVCRGSFWDAMLPTPRLAIRAAKHPGWYGHVGFRLARY